MFPPRAGVHESNLFKQKSSGDDDPTKSGWRTLLTWCYNHGAKIHGRAYAWTLLSRIFLAETWRRW